jgi:hypothetical protein
MHNWKPLGNHAAENESSFPSAPPTGNVCHARNGSIRSGVYSFVAPIIVRQPAFAVVAALLLASGSGVVFGGNAQGGVLLAIAILFIGVTVFLLLLGLVQRTVAGDVEIAQYNLLNQRIFSAPWGEIDRCERSPRVRLVKAKTWTLSSGIQSVNVPYATAPLLKLMVKHMKRTSWQVPPRRNVPSQVQTYEGRLEGAGDKFLMALLSLWYAFLAFSVVRLAAVRMWPSFFHLTRPVPPLNSTPWILIASAALFVVPLWPLAVVIRKRRNEIRLDELGMSGKYSGRLFQVKWADVDFAEVLVEKGWRSPTNYTVTVIAGDQMFSASMIPVLAEKTTGFALAYAPQDALIFPGVSP